MSFQVQVQKTAKHPVIRLVDTSTGSYAEIFAIGGLLNAFGIQGSAQTINIIDGFDDVRDAEMHMTNAFKSAKLCPFVCRMKEGQYQFNNATYRVNGFYLGNHALHGLLYQSFYKIIDQGTGVSNAYVTLEHQYPGNDPGYPFPFTLTIQWQLHNQHRLTVATTVVHQHALPIPFSDGWHPYFNLGVGIDNLTLQFDTATKLVFDQELIPNGELENDNRFLKGSSLKGITLDNCFLLPDTGARTCILDGNGKKLTIAPAGSYPYLQVYTPPHRNSIAIENLSAAPDAFNNGMGLLLLEPATIHLFGTSYQLDITDPPLL